MRPTFLKRLDSSKPLKEIDLGLSFSMSNKMMEFFKAVTLTSAFDMSAFEVSNSGPIPNTKSIRILLTLEQATNLPAYQKAIAVRAPLMPMDKTEMRGIYSLENDELVYCWSQPGQPRPTSFKVTKDDGRTLIRLKRFSTGEAEIEKQFLEMGVQFEKEKELGWIEAVTISTVQDVEVAIELASQLKKLRALKVVAGNPVLNKNQFIASNAPEVPFVPINSTISAASMKQLAKCTKLLTLNLNGITIEEAGTEYLSKCTGLEVLVLDRTGVNDDGILQLKDLKQLRFLSLNNTRITDKALGHIADSIPSLSNLSARGIENFTDEGLAKLSQLESLKSISVSPNTFSSEAVAKTGKLWVLQSRISPRLKGYPKATVYRDDGASQGGGIF